MPLRKSHQSWGKVKGDIIQEEVSLIAPSGQRPRSTPACRGPAPRGREGRATQTVRRQNRRQQNWEWTFPKLPKIGVKFSFCTIRERNTDLGDQDSLPLIVQEESISTSWKHWKKLDRHHTWNVKKSVSKWCSKKYLKSTIERNFPHPASSWCYAEQVGAWPQSRTDGALLT